MPVYNFKKIGAVPSAPELVDIVLMRTQRKTPTVVHPGYKITRIRSFYMRKIKFTQQTISERLTNILTEFPRLNDIHPFYADLCNTLYDRDHYKLALGQLNAARSVIDSIARDMIRMVKYGDTLYRCKCLKRAALGRMCTILKRQKASLAYLEEVRRHLSRLPALDPNTRTILMCGYPNVGKSSFMNKITRSNVDVQPYAFTTKSLFVGHCDYKYLRWQVIDTPGILDHPLEERNTIEMQAIIALAHLTCSVLYFIDISEQCGYSIQEQCSLFQSIQPLFSNKQLIVVINKVDQQPWETLEEDKKSFIQQLVDKAGSNCSLMTMSNISEKGVSEVKAAACDKLLDARVDARIAGNKIDNVMNRLQVFYPTPRDHVQREACIPQSVIQQQNETNPKPKRSRLGYAPTVNDNDDHHHQGGDQDMDDYKKTARDFMWENGGAGVWAPDYREIYDLKNDEWKFDAIPQLLDGKNIADFIDPDIDQKLLALEQEEEQLVQEYNAAQMEEQTESDLDEEEEAAVHAIRDRKKLFKIMSHVNNTTNKPMAPREIRGRAKDKYDSGGRDSKQIKKVMDQYGIDASLMLERGRSVDRESRGKKRDRSLTEFYRRRDADTAQDNDDIDMAMEEEEQDQQLSKGKHKKQKKSKQQTERQKLSDIRSHTPKDKSEDKQKFKGIHPDEKTIANKLEKQGRKGWAGASGEGDQTKSVHLVKWMNTGKKRMGTHYCR